MLVDAPPILRLHRSKLKIAADDSIDREKTQPTLKQRLKHLCEWAADSIIEHVRVCNSPVRFACPTSRYQGLQSKVTRSRPSSRSDRDRTT